MSPADFELMRLAVLMPSPAAVVGPLGQPVAVFVQAAAALGVALLHPGTGTGAVVAC